MFIRHLKLPKNDHILLLGPRSTGKSTYIRSHYPKDETLWIDLLKDVEEDRYSRTPDLLANVVQSLSKKLKYIVIDEIQKIPKLLDVVHSLIESSEKQLRTKRFILTGSSARKLRTSSANLLAGRALFYRMAPLTSFELGKTFNLERALKFGMLPRIWTTKSETVTRKSLETYALTYLNEEVRMEQIVKNLSPFRKFLEVAAQMNGKIVNFSNVADDTGVDEKTVRNYYQILEDTLLGFFLEHFETSVRKKIFKSPKFFFFDTGVVRALSKQLTLDLVPGNYLWGDAFEHFVILEIQKLIQYSGNDFSLHYLRTYDDLEIDLVIDRPGKSRLYLEIKSTNEISERQLKNIITLSKSIKEPHELLCLSQDPKKQVIQEVKCFPWQEGIRRYFQGPDLKL
jgi:uncharacterized protein